MWKRDGDLTFTPADLVGPFCYSHSHSYSCRLAIFILSLSLLLVSSSCSFYHYYHPYGFSSPDCYQNNYEHGNQDLLIIVTTTIAIMIINDWQCSIYKVKEFSVCLGMWKSDVICLCTGEHRGLLGTISFGASFFSAGNWCHRQNDIQLPKAVESQWHRNSKVSWGRKVARSEIFCDDRSEGSHPGPLWCHEWFDWRSDQLTGFLAWWVSAAGGIWQCCLLWLKSP